MTVFVGFAFVLIVVRNLTPEDFGTWSLLTTMLGHFLIADRVISFWTTRQIARNEQVGKTSVMSSLLFAFGLMPIYLALVFFVASQSNASLEPLILGSLLLIVFFLSRTISSINLGHKPHVDSYGLLVLELAKIPTALFFVYVLGFDINGVILSVLISYVVKIAVQYYYARPKLQNSLSFSVLRRWLKISWINLYASMGPALRHSDVLIYSVITGSVVGIAYHAAALMVVKIIHHSEAISKPLYPKLLGEGSQQIPQTIALQMYFAIPLLGIVLVFSKPAMHALNPIYDEVAIITIVLAFQMFFAEIRGIYKKILQGIDTVDIAKKPRFSSLLKSKIFYTHTMNNVRMGLQLVALGSVFYFMAHSGYSEIDIVFWWVLVVLIFEIPFTVNLAVRVRKYVTFQFPKTRIIKYLLSTVAFMGIFYLVSDHLIGYQNSIYEFLPGVIATFLICVGVYLSMTFVLDKKIRILFKTIINEITHNKQFRTRL